MMGFFWWLLKMGPSYMATFLIFGQLMTWKEIVSLNYKMTKEQKLWGFRTLNWFWMFVTFFWVYGKPIVSTLPGFVTKHYERVPNLDEVCAFLESYHEGVSVCLYVVALVLFVWSLQEDTLKYQINQLAWTIVSLLLVVGQARFAIDYLYIGLIWVLLPPGLIMVNDIMAYFCGIALGRKLIKRPLYRLSPNKTWEGFLGALMCTLAFAFFIVPYLVGPGSEWLTCPHDDPQCKPNAAFVRTMYTVPTVIQNQLSGLVSVPKQLSLYPLQIHAIVLALFASLVAPFGGFLASAIKRAYHAKDYAALFPGHGGFMDRVDCQFMMCTFTYIYLKTFIYHGTEWATGCRK